MPGKRSDNWMNHLQLVRCYQRHEYIFESPRAVFGLICSRCPLAGLVTLVTRPETSQVVRLVIIHLWPLPSSLNQHNQWTYRKTLSIHSLILHAHLVRWSGPQRKAATAPPHPPPPAVRLPHNKHFSSPDFLKRPTEALLTVILPESLPPSATSPPFWGDIKRSPPAESWSAV